MSIASIAVALAAAGHAARLDAQSRARDVRVILLTPRPGPATPGEADHAFATLAAGVTDTLVVAAYGLDRAPVLTAIVETQNRLATPWAVGIVVDVDDIGGKESANALATAGISITQRNSSALMHDKFAVFGRHVVWTGSANFTDDGFARNFENIVIITSTELAEGYRGEFERMHRQRQFSTGKPTRQPLHMTIGDGEVQVAFAPNGGAEALIIDLLAAARTSVDVAAHEFTRTELAHALATAAVGGASVRVLYDDGHQRGDSVSAKVSLCIAGALVFEEKSRGTLHHKYAIIDWPTADSAPMVSAGGRPVVVTGSANWTVNGMTKNDENVMAVHNATVAARFTSDFEQLWDGPVYEQCGTFTLLPFVANAAVVTGAWR